MVLFHCAHAGSSCEQWCMKWGAVLNHCVVLLCFINSSYRYKNILKGTICYVACLPDLIKREASLHWVAMQLFVLVLSLSLIFIFLNLFVSVAGSRFSHLFPNTAPLCMATVCQQLHDNLSLTYQMTNESSHCWVEFFVKVHLVWKVIWI